MRPGMSDMALSEMPAVSLWLTTSMPVMAPSAYVTSTVTSPLLPWAVPVQTVSAAVVSAVVSGAAVVWAAVVAAGVVSAVGVLEEQPDRRPPVRERTASAANNFWCLILLSPPEMIFAVLSFLIV